MVGIIGFVEQYNETQPFKVETDRRTNDGLGLKGIVKSQFLRASRTLSTHKHGCKVLLLSLTSQDDLESSLSLGRPTNGGVP